MALATWFIVEGDLGWFKRTPSPTRHSATPLFAAGGDPTTTSLPPARRRTYVSRPQVGCHKPSIRAAGTRAIRPPSAVMSEFG